MQVHVTVMSLVVISLCSSLPQKKHMIITQHNKSHFQCIGRVAWHQLFSGISIFTFVDVEFIFDTSLSICLYFHSLTIFYFLSYGCRFKKKKSKGILVIHNMNEWLSQDSLVQDSKKLSEGHYYFKN